MYTEKGEPSNTAFGPIATVVTYFGDDTGNTLSNLFSFTTGTKWRDINAAIHQVGGNSGSDPHAVIDEMFSNGGGFSTGESSIMKNIIGDANFVTGKMFSFGKFVGLLSPDGYNINKDQAYFDKIFTFTSKMMYGYHPMISPENVHNACKNIDWWVEMYEKHNLDKSPNHRHPYPAMLEVRNDYWTDEQLKDYSTYLKHLWDICLKLNKDSFKNMARYLFVGDGKDGSLPSSGDYDPLKIMYMDEEDSRHLLGCTMQELIRINVADLSLCTCHRLTYPQFTGGKYVLNENNEIVDLEPQAVTAWISLRAGSPAYYPKCENCEYNPVCMKGCLGSQYEYSGEIYYPIPKVCELEKTKINTMLELYYNGGIIATAIRENMIQRDSEIANYLIKLSEMRGYKIEL